MKKRILVIDDEVEICMLLSAMLKKMGFSTNCVHTIADALELLSKETFQVVFVDLNLPDGLGFRLIKDIRRFNSGSRVVVISAYDGLNERQHAEAEGADHFIAKPFNKKRVEEALTKFNIQPSGRPGGGSPRIF